MRSARAVKRPTGSAVREPLSYALGTRAKVACLRLLSLTTELVTQREVARRAGLQHRSVQLALDELVTLGLVCRVEGGRDFLVRLNASHRLARSLVDLFRVESEQFLELRRQLVRDLEPKGRSRGVEAVALFGSAARGEDDADSDLDLLVIGRDAATRDAAVERLTEIAERIRIAFGVRVKPVGYTRRDAQRLWRTRQAPLREIGRDALLLVGSPLTELLNGAH